MALRVTRGYAMRTPRSLSARQREVVDLASRGLSNKEIGTELGITEDTVKNHVSAAFRFAVVENRTELTRWWLEQEAGAAEPVPEPRPAPIGWTLAAAVVVAQLLDLLTWLAMPRAAEVNPIAQGLHTPTAWVLKGLLVLLVLGIQPALRPKYAAVGELVAVVAIAAGCVGAGSNLAVLAYVNAAEAARPATQPAPVSIGTTGNEQGTQAPAAEPRTATSRDVAPPLPAVTVWTPVARKRSTPPVASAHAGSLTGRASWFLAERSVAAAGPALRRALGRHWRGTLVRVSAGGRSVVVRLSDWCQCLQGQRSERIVDLSDVAFAELAPLATGLIVVRIRTVALVPPATSTR